MWNLLKKTRERTNEPAAGLPDAPAQALQEDPVPTEPAVVIEEAPLPAPTLKPKPKPDPRPERTRVTERAETPQEGVVPVRTQVVCLANFKGGVGKSMTAVNLSAGLAAAGHRVLLVDCDPQANSSEMFLHEDEIRFDLRSVIVDRMPLDEVIQKTRLSGLDVLPASFDLVFLDKELVVTPNGILRISKALRPADGQYDYIVADTGPNLSHLTLGALVAAHHIVIPVSAAVWSTAGLRKFMRWVQDNQDEEVITAQLLGLVATRVRPRTRIGQALIEQLKTGDLPAFETYIPERIGAEDAAFERAVIGEPGADPTISTAYSQLTKEVVTRVEERQGGKHAR